MTPEIEILIELTGWLLAIFGIVFLVEKLIYGKP